MIKRITQSTELVSAMHILHKPEGKLRICLDPRNPNKVITREHFKLSTREEVVVRMAGAKNFPSRTAQKVLATTIGRKVPGYASL